MKRFPFLPTVDLSILPGMVIEFDTFDDQSVNTVVNAMQGDQFVVVSCQKELKQEINVEDIEEIGTLCLIKKMYRYPNPKEGIRIMVMAVERVRILSLEDSEDGYYTEITTEFENSLRLLKEIELAAMVRQLKDLLKAYTEHNEQFSPKVFKRLQGIDSVDKLTEQVFCCLSFDNRQRQEVLNLLDPFERYVYLCRYLMEELEILYEKDALKKKLHEAVDKNQKEYYLKEQLRLIRKELGEDDESLIDEYQEKLEQLEASDEVKEKIKKEIRNLRQNQHSSSESAVIRTYIENLLEMPWEHKKEDNSDLSKAKDILDEDHYGLKKVKERILDYLVIRYLNPKSDAPILCLYGPPGTGKTSIAKSIARALDKEYVRVCLGGVRDEAEIRGHRRTYVGAMPGRIAEGIKNSGVKNPLMLLDEIDKTGADRRGDTASALLEVLDSEQNSHFKDHYLEVPMDLSEVFFIATANDLSQIPKPLLDRLEVITISGYTENEKYHIAKEHLIPKQLQKAGIRRSNFTMTDQAVYQVIRQYTREAGVRELERQLAKIMSRSAHELLDTIWEQHGTENDLKEFSKKKIHIGAKRLETYLGKKKYDPLQKNRKAEVGIVRGLAWTSVGGVTLEIEVNVIPGDGKIEFTGKLGDVMQESARVAFSYVRALAPKYKISKEYFKEHDFHMHIPEGAVPKDGPSAGITMTLALLSAVTNRKVKEDLAMTGEITLRGNVLPIGGLKEKLLAAKEAGIHHVIVPKKNEPDVLELEEEILDQLSITYASKMEDVIKAGLLE